MLSIIRLTKINLYKHLGTVNFWIPFILAVAAVYEFSHSLSDMTRYYSLPVNGFAATFLFTSLNQTFIIFLGIFILFSDLPFKDNQQMFLISRSGKRAWIFSQIFYVIIVSLVYFLFIFACFCIVLMPNLGFNTESWGKIIKTISATNASQNFHLFFTVSPSVLSDFSPLEAFVYSFGTAFAVAVIMGLVVLLFNLTVKHSAGVFISGALVFVYMFVYMGGGSITYYFSPLNWCSILIADKNGVSAYPDVSWIVAVLCIAFAVEIIALFIFGGKKIKFVLDTREEIS